MLLKANGLDEPDYYIQPLHGVNNLTAAAPVADFFTRQGTNTFVVVHRDGDGMVQYEKDWWIGAESKKLPERSLVFVTTFTDIEHSFCQPKHIAAVYGITEQEASTLVEGVLDENNAQFIVEFTHKRSMIKNTALRHMEEAASTADIIGKKIVFEQVRGKSLLPLILKELEAKHLNPMRLCETPSDALIAASLKNFFQSAHVEGQAPINQAVLGGLQEVTK